MDFKQVMSGTTTSKRQKVSANDAANAFLSGNIFCMTLSYGRPLPEIKPDLTQYAIIKELHFKIVQTYHSTISLSSEFND